MQRAQRSLRLSIVLLLAVLCGPAAAQVSETIAYQGYLTDADGNPFDGTASFVFRLYDQASGGMAVWAEAQNDVPVSEGVFAARLGAVEPLGDVAFDRPLWLAVYVNGGAELAPRIALAAAPNFIFGIASNTIAEGLRAVTIGGGGDIFNPNEVTASYATIGGGWGNTVAGNGGTVGGGGNNDVAGVQATIGGGSTNQAGGSHATVPVGLFNKANGDFSMAAGARARALHEGTFVWSDNSSVLSFSSTAANQYLIRATGGVGIGTNGPTADLHIFADSGPQPQLLLEEDDDADFARLRMKNVSSTEYWDVAAGVANSERLNFFASNGRGNVMSLRATGDPLVMHNGARLTEGGTWTNASSRLLKTDFQPVDGQEVLALLMQVPIQTWRYKVEAGARHMGPMAEAFAAAFGLGDTDKAIATVDADGVALAAIQGLRGLIEAQQAQIEALQAQVAELEALVRTRSPDDP